MPHFSRLLFLKKIQRHMHSICVWDMIKQSKPLQTRYDKTYIYIYILYKNTYTCVPFQCEKNACLDYREFDLEGDLAGVPYTWYLSSQSFIRLLKLV